MCISVYRFKDLTSLSSPFLGLACLLLSLFFRPPFPPVRLKGVTEPVHLSFCERAKNKQLLQSQREGVFEVFSPL